MKNPFIGRGLTIDDKPGEVEYLLEGFLAKEVITLYYAPPKNGKSVMAFALAQYACTHGAMQVLYFDFDNPVTMLEDRKIFKLLPTLKTFDYIHPEKVAMSSKEALREMLEFAKQPNKPLLNCFLVFDSVVNFSNENSADSFMLHMKTLRNAGATILLLHHMNKSERGYEGSQVYISASDNIFTHKMASETDAFSTFTHKKHFARFKGACHSAFEVKKENFELTMINYDDAVISPSDQEFIDKVINVIRKKKDGIGQNHLLKDAGFKSTHKQAIAMLHNYTDRFWRIEKGQKNSKQYFVL